MLMCLNKIAPGTDLELLGEHVEALYRVPVAAMMMLNTEIVRLGSGDIFTNRFPDHPFTLELKKVAQRLIDGALGKSLDDTLIQT